MITLIPFSHDHIPFIINKEITTHEISSIIIPDTRLAYTATGNGLFLGAGGLVPLWPRVAEAWVIISAEGHNNKISVGRIILKTLLRSIEQCKFVRVQATIHSENRNAKKLIEWLGFSLEGEFKNYGPDLSTYYHYARQIP